MLVNKRLTAGNINLLRLMFPNYDLINETNIPENPVRPAIYSGDTIKVDEFVKKYTESHLDYIVAAFKSEINLDDRRTLCNVIFEKWRHATLPKYLDNIIDNIQPDQFIEMVKYKWITGKWTIKEIENENNFLSLVEELNKSKYELLNTYFKCLEENKPYILESSILTFLNKAKTETYQGNSFQYRKKLKLYKGRKMENTLRALDESFEYNIDNPELRLLNILMNIQDSGKNS